MTVQNDAFTLKKLFEADPFKGADPDDIRARKTKAQNRIDTLKKDAKKILKTGPSNWRQYPEEAWPELDEENICPVCGVEYAYGDFQDEDGEDDTERWVYICSNCGSESAMKYEVSREYVGTEVIDVPSGEGRLREAETAGDPFKSADPDDVVVRQEAAKLKQDEKNRERAAARLDQDFDLMQDAMAQGKVPVFAIITDQGSISFDKIGYFWYNEDEDMFLDEDRDAGGEPRTKEELEEDYYEDNYENSIGVHIDAVFREDLESIRNDLTDIISHESRPRGTEDATL